METNFYTTREGAVAASSRYLTSSGGKTHLPVIFSGPKDGIDCWYIDPAYSACGSTRKMSHNRNRYASQPARLVTRGDEGPTCKRCSEMEAK